MTYKVQNHHMHTEMLTSKLPTMLAALTSRIAANPISPNYDVGDVMKPNYVGESVTVAMSFS